MHPTSQQHALADSSSWPQLDSRYSQCVQVHLHQALEAYLTTATWRRRKTFASADAARARLADKAPFNEFTSGSLDAYIKHDMVQREGALQYTVLRKQHGVQRARACCCALPVKRCCFA
jgi:hypothetical protein